MNFVADMMQQYKTHIWGLVEYHSAAVLHATATVVGRLDRLQTSFLEELQVTQGVAFVEFNLGPTSFGETSGFWASFTSVCSKNVTPQSSRCCHSVTSQLAVGGTRNNYMPIWRNASPNDRCMKDPYSHMCTCATACHNTS